MLNGNKDFAGVELLPFAIQLRMVRDKNEESENIFD